MYSSIEDDVSAVFAEALKNGFSESDFETWRFQARNFCNRIGMTPQEIRRLADKYGRRV